MAGPGETALRALAGGDLTGWRELPVGLAPAAVEAALGSAPTAQGPVLLFGTGAQLGRYPATAGAPHGLAVWFVAGAADLVEIGEPALAAPVADQLGPPETRVESLLGPGWSQLVYAERGLVVHVSGATDRPRRLYGFAAGPVKQFLTGPLRAIEQRLIPD
jgi:hypothetical protein